MKPIRTLSKIFFLSLSVSLAVTAQQPESGVSWVGESLIDSRGNTVWARSLADCQYLLIYRASEASEASRGFTPQLIRFWERNRSGNSFDVVLLSEDGSREKLLNHMQSQQLPWYALEPASPFSDKLREAFGGKEIPALLVVDKSGVLVASSFDKDGEYLGTGSVLTVLAERLLTSQKSDAEVRAERMQADAENRKLAMQLLYDHPDQLAVGTIAKLFPITGVLKTNDGYVALLGTKVVKPGQVLEKVVTIKSITRDDVVIHVGGREITLHPEGYHAP